MEYFKPKEIAEALQLLEKGGHDARIIAGGTDLLIDLNNRKFSADLLVDITDIDELKRITIEGDELVIGSAVTLTTIARNNLVCEHAEALAAGCASVGSLQIRNIATLGGNVVNAQPAADGAMGLSVFEPTFIVCSMHGTRKLTMEQMYAGFGKSSLDSGKELLTEIRIPCRKEGEASAFKRLELRKYLSLPMINAAAAVHMEDGYIKWARISMAPVGIGPVRAREAEAWLCGKQLSKENIQKASSLALKEANPRSNPLRGSREYRIQVLPTIIEDCLNDIASKLASNQ